MGNSRECESGLPAVALFDVVPAQLGVSDAELVHGFDVFCINTVKVEVAILRGAGYQKGILRVRARELVTHERSGTFNG